MVLSLFKFFGSFAGQPRLVRVSAGVNQRLHMSYVVVTEVYIPYIRSRLVVTRGDSGYGILFGKHPQCQHGDKVQRLTSLMAHQAYSTLVNHMVECGEAAVALVLHAHKVVLQVGLQLPLLLSNVWKVNEEPRAHVALE